MKSSFLEVGIHFRWVVLLFLILTSILAAFGVPKLTVDTSMNSLIAEDEPMRPDYERIIDEFGSDRTTIIYIKDRNLWSAEKLAIIDEIHYELQNLEFISKVDSLYTATSIRDVDGTLDSDTILIDPPTDLEEIAQAKDNALYSPLIRKNFISEDGTVTAINVTLKPSNGPRFDELVTNTIEEIIGPRRSIFEKIFAVGSPRIATEMNKSLLTDLSWLGPAAAGVLMATIIVFLRSGFAAFVPLVSAGLAIVWTFGLMGWFGIPMNILSAMLPTLIVVIGATEDTHMLSVYLASLKDKETSDKQRKRRDAAVVMARHVGIPVILTTLTTFIGFASNGFSAIGMIKDFAFASAFGVAANGLITILFVPLILSWFGPLSTKIVSDQKEISGFQGSILFGLNYLRKKHPGKVMLVTILLFSFCLFKAFDLTVSNAPLTYFKKDHPLVVQNTDIHKDLAGTGIFYITFESGEIGAFKQPENLNKLVEIKDLIYRQGKLDQTISIVDHLSLVNREWSEGDPKEFRPPQMPMLVDQYLLFFQRRDIENYINHDFSNANMVVRHNIQDSHELNKIIAELDVEISKIIGGDFPHVFVGEGLMVNNAAERLMAAQVGAIGLLLVVIVLMMSILFTSWRGGAISLIPNLIPIVWAFGIMSIFKIPINPGTATVAVIAIGIAIDDTIHLLTKFNEESRIEVDRDIAVEKTVKYEAIPVISTSVSLMAGFAVLLGSEFSIVAQFGALAAATMLFAVIADLLVTPIIMGKVRLVGLADILTLKLDRKILVQSPLFQNMSWYAIKKAILLSNIIEFQKNENIIKSGDIGREMYLIIAGSVNVVVGSGKSKKVIANLKTGHVFGEIGFVKETKRSADVVALEDTKLLEFNFEKMQKNMKLYPNIASKLHLNISRILGERLAETARASSKSNA